MTDVRPASADLQPLGLVLGALIRRSYVIVAITALAAAGTWFAIGPSDSDSGQYAATSRVGITTVTQWPFYDVELDRGRLMVDDVEFVTALEAELGIDVIDVSTTIPDALAVFDVTAVADTPEHAVAAADRAAEMVVERNVAALQQDTTDQIAQTQLEITDLQTRVDAARASVDQQNEQIAEIVAQQQAEWSDLREEQRFAISLDRDVQQNLYNTLSQELATKQSALVTLQSAGAPLSVYEVLRRADTPGESSSKRLPATLAAALAALLVTSTLVVVADRRTGPVRSAWQLRSICGARTAAVLRRSGPALQGTGPLADAIHGAVDQGTGVLGLVDATGRGLDLGMVVQQLGARGLGGLLVDVPLATPPNSKITFVDVSDEYRDPDSARVRSNACDSIVLFVDTRTSVKDARSIVDRIEVSPGLLIAFLVSSR